MRIFVAGATGVIGRRVVPLLVAAGHRVTAVVRSAQGYAALQCAGAVPVQVDLFDSAAVRRALLKHRVVINLATHMPSSTARMLMPGAWRENDRLRREAAAIIADAASAAGVERLIQESFALVYPDCNDAWIDEATPIAPARYNRTVADAEAAAAHFGSRGGTAVVLRFAAFYGSDAAHVRGMIAMVRKGWAPLPGSPDAYFSSVSHDDAASAVAAALGVRAGIYNVVDDEPLRRRDYADALAAALGAGPPRFSPAWLARLAGSLGELLSRSQRISNRRLRTESGWMPRYRSAREGWRATLRASPPHAAAEASRATSTV